MSCTIEKEILQLLWSKGGTIRVQNLERLRHKLKSSGFSLEVFGPLVRNMRNLRLIKITKLRDGSGLTEITLLRKGYERLGGNKRPVLAAA